MKKLSEETVPYNSGWAGEVRQGQVIRIAATTTVDFVAFDRHNPRDRFDQARTKVFNMKIFISTGDKLLSKSNQFLLTIVHDGFTEGTHDLQKGTCSASRFALAKREGQLAYYFARGETEAPDHGCWENLSQVLHPYGIAPEDIPSPINLNQHMKIDTAGRMQHTTVRPKPGSYVDLRAERDLLIAFSACPDLAVGGKPVTVEIYEAD